MSFFASRPLSSTILSAIRFKYAGGALARSPLSTTGRRVCVQVFSVPLTMFFAGVWHGVDFIFAIFGTLHGINHAWTEFWAPQRDAAPSRAVRWPKIALTYVAVVVSLVFFRAATC